MAEHTKTPWEGRNDGLVSSKIGNVRFILRMERHGPASTLDDEDRACLGLVLRAVSAHDALVAATSSADDLFSELYQIIAEMDQAIDSDWLNRIVAARTANAAALKLAEPATTAQYDPDHLNPSKGGNRAGDDYW